MESIYQHGACLPDEAGRIIRHFVGDPSIERRTLCGLPADLSKDQQLSVSRTCDACSEILSGVINRRRHGATMGAIRPVWERSVPTIAHVEGWTPMDEAGLSMSNQWKPGSPVSYGGR